MKETIQHPVYGEIIYSESLWTGKKSLKVNGADAPSVSKKEYTVNGKSAILKGNFLIGSSLQIDGESIQLAPKLKWYEIVLAVIPFLFLVIWGNSATLCSVFPVVGGAIGGGLGGACAILSLVFMKSNKSLLVKIIIGVISIAATILIAFLLALLLISFL